MPFTATSKNFDVPPREALDLNERYLVRVASITEKRMGKYGAIKDPATNEYRPEDLEDKMVWSLETYHLNGSPVINAEGGIYCNEPITGMSVAPSRPGKQVAKARTYAEGILGRDPKLALDDGEDLMALLTNRYAYCLFDLVIQTDGLSKLKILRLTPIADAKQQAAAAAVAGGIAGASVPATAAPASLPF